MIMTGYCSCDSPILEFAGNFFIKGVYQAALILEKVLCPALQALDIVMAVGMAAIPSPGQAITGGMGEYWYPLFFLSEANEAVAAT
jgi:ABC-type branched-subunit amino acid transport system permease subunit